MQMLKMMLIKRMQRRQRMMKVHLKWLPCR
jgi:hypothetical protein